MANIVRVLLHGLPTLTMETKRFRKDERMTRSFLDIYDGQQV